MQPDANFSEICFALHIILNLVVGVTLMALIPSQIMKQNVSSATSSLFWSAAIIGALLVLCFIVQTLLNYVISITTMDFIDHDEVVSMTITFVLLLFLLTLELIVAILRSKHSGLAVPRCMGYCCSFFCFCCFCCCCRPRGRSHSRVARALSLWFVMAGLQLIASSTIPLIIAVFFYNPLSFIASFALVVNAYFGIVVFLAVLVHICSQHNRSKRCLFCVYSLIFIGIIVMVCLVFRLFVLIAVHGGQVKSIPGFIGTLVPSAILSIITWFVKTKVLGKTETNQSSEQPPDENTLLLKGVVRD